MRRRTIPDAPLAAAAVVAATVLAAGCGSAPQRDGPPARDVDPASVPDAVPRAEPKSRYGNPPSYVVLGKRYHVLDSSHGYVERGIASWYGKKFHGRRTSSGEPYDMYRMTAAHRTLPLPTYAEVVNLQNGRRAVVRINDRGPFHANRIIDLSYAAARRLGIVARGTGLVEVRAIDAGAPPPDPAARVRIARPEGATLYLQVGAFVTRLNAERLSARVASLDGARTPVRIHEVESGGRTVYRVQLGPLPGVEQADRLARILVASGHADYHVVVE